MLLYNVNVIVSLYCYNITNSRDKLQLLLHLLERKMKKCKIKTECINSLNNFIFFLSLKHFPVKTPESFYNFLYVVDKTQQGGICTRMLQSESLDGYNWELAAIFKRRRRHGFALFSLRRRRK